MERHYGKRWFGHYLTLSLYTARGPSSKTSLSPVSQASKVPVVYVRANGKCRVGAKPASNTPHMHWHRVATSAREMAANEEGGAVTAQIGTWKVCRQLRLSTAGKLALMSEGSEQGG